MRPIKLIVWHCSDSDNPKHDNIETLRAWHLSIGNSDIGYHYVITKDGVAHTGRDVAFPGAHCLGFNAHSIGVCVIGRNEFTHEQFNSLLALTRTLMKSHNVDKADVVGHELLDKHGKTCPNFNWRDLVIKL